MSSRAAAFLAVVLLGACALAGEPAASGFAAKPAVAKDGEKVKITFAVAAPTDVEVAVLDADGKVVRHLAAGVLGAKNPPPEPLKAGLAQDLVWDGADDFGRQVSGVSVQVSGNQPDTRNLKPDTSFRIRVRSGLKLQVGAVLASDPFYTCYPLGMATDDAGNLYFLSSSTIGQDFAHLRVFNRKGEYLRTVLPMPGDLPLEKAKLFEAIQTGGNTWAPRNRCGTWPDFYRKATVGGGSTWQMANRVGKDGVITLCNSGSILRLRGDGSPAGAEVQPAPIIPGKKPAQYAPIAPYFNCAASPDGSRVYVTGMNGGRWKQKKSDADFAAGRILAIEGKETKTFADVALGDKPLRNDLTAVNCCDLEGMTCDAQGNLYVCDPTSGKVRVFDPAGKETGEFPVENAVAVACHRKTGEFYVLCIASGYTQGKKALKKFSPLKDGAKELASIALPLGGETGCMALDDSAEPAVVWAAIRTGHDGYRIGNRARVIRLEDKGAAFAETPHPISFGVDGIRERLAVHPETELVAYKGQFTDAGAVNGLTGEAVKLPFGNCIDMAAGQDGNWYFHTTASWAGFVCKYDKDLKPIPTVNSQLPPSNPAGKPPANAVGYAYGKYGWGIAAGGMAIDRAGRLFSFQIGNENVHGGYFVIVFGPDGKAEEHPYAKDHPSFSDPQLGHTKNKPDARKFYNSALVAMVNKVNSPYVDQGGGCQIDYQGNVYIGTNLVPVDVKPPAGYEKEPSWTNLVGSVLKFPKEGGQCIQMNGETPPAGKKGMVIRRLWWADCKVFAENATAIYPDMATFSGGLGNGCSCRHPMFAVDGYGRLAIPNAITFRVRLADNAGNEILSFGKYGNMDAVAQSLRAVQAALPEGDPLKKQEITPAKPDGINALLKAKPLAVSEAAFGWPESVAASDRALYVADIYNHCIVRLDKAYAGEAVEAVK
jgi:hypothetical protein